MNYPYQIKWVEKANRNALPPEVKILFYLTLKEHPVSINLIEETRKKYPDYFERVDKPTIYMP
tara:strand:- start:1179 stop:1367 length:189 start_codon:yes stop_codon:yes gene_type:complete